MNKLALLAVIPLSLGACLDMGSDESSTEQAATGEAGHGAPEHLQQTKDAAPAGTTSGSPLLVWGGGGVLHANKTQAIFWGANWNTSFAGDKITGLDTFFGGFGGSLYAGASTEYTDSTGHVTSSSTYLGHVMDTSSNPPSKALTTSSAVAEACKIANNSPDPNALYLIYTQSGPSHASYCAWHSWGTCSTGAPIQVAYMPNIDGVAGCDPGAPYAGHSQGLAALANVTAHELSETITDPRGTGWTDSGGAENGDKCAWSFSPNNGGVVSLNNGSTWKLQGEWSNAAFTAGTGYANRSGQLACLPLN